MKENVPITNPVEMVDPNWMQKTGGYARDMTMRDEFAGRAMQGLIGDHIRNFDLLATEAYQMAEAMLKEREK
jgi:hypothetical protein